MAGLGYNIPVSFSGSVGVNINDPFEVAYSSPGQTLNDTFTPTTTSTATAAEGNAGVGGSAATPTSKSTLTEWLFIGGAALAAWFLFKKGII